MIADGVERSVRLGAAAALLASFARRRGRTPRASSIERSRTMPGGRRSGEDAHPASGRDRPQRPWVDLAWWLAIFLLLAIVAYTALHGADVLADLDELRWPGY
ncbi:MAG: hypothetical protein ABI900_13610 [Betaproteobacteria bacterium]